MSKVKCNRFKGMISAVMSLAIFASFVPNIRAEEQLSEDIVILYTNDVHTYIDGKLSYDVISAVKKDLKKKYKYVYLVDAGDHIQGTAYGSMDKGKSIIEMMNKSEYDVATLGNHEFDYGMDGCMKAIELADFPYVSANFYHEENGVRKDNVLDSFEIFECGGEKIAFVGITTPETFEKSTSAYFQNESGEFIYGISGGADGGKMYEDVQKAIDEAEQNGATQIIALGHLGIDQSSTPWTSRETISSVSGLDAFIDGHSHSVVKNETVTDKDGNDVLLTQTGSYFDRIGMMIIDSETDEITTDFIECSKNGDSDESYGLSSTVYSTDTVISDSAVKTVKDEWISEIDDKLGNKIGVSDVVFDNYDEAGNRLVRSEETNTGDFAADALYYLFDNMGMQVDAAIMNGGGVRNTAITGDISYKTCKDIHTFGNVACLQTVTGQQILDALEWGARQVGNGENGGFLQVSGVAYKIDKDIPNTVKENEIGTWVSGPEVYRVFDVKIYDKESGEYKELDRNGEYNLAGYNYTLRNLGDGYAMFDGAVNLLDYVMEDYMVLANYTEGFENGVIGADNSPLKKKYPNMLLDYGTTNGSGRIEIAEKSENSDYVLPYEDVNDLDWFYDDVAYATKSGLFNGVTDTAFAPNGSLTRGMLVTVLYRAENEPEIAEKVSFDDVDSNAYYSSAVAWAKQNGLVDGVTDELFAPEKYISREQIAAVLFRYAGYKGVAPVGVWAIRLDYADIADIDDYAIEGVMYTSLEGIMQGRDNNLFEPNDDVTRAEAAVVLNRFMQLNNMVIN